MEIGDIHREWRSPILHRKPDLSYHRVFFQVIRRHLPSEGESCIFLTVLATGRILLMYPSGSLNSSSVGSKTGASGGGTNSSRLDRIADLSNNPWNYCISVLHRIETRQLDLSSSCSQTWHKLQQRPNAVLTRLWIGSPSAARSLGDQAAIFFLSQLAHQPAARLPRLPAAANRAASYRAVEIRPCVRKLRCHVHFFFTFKGFLFTTSGLELLKFETGVGNGDQGFCRITTKRFFFPSKVPQ